MHCILYTPIYTVYCIHLYTLYTVYNYIHCLLCTVYNQIQLVIILGIHTVGDKTENKIVEIH